MSAEEADDLQEIIEKAQSLPVWNQTGLGGLKLDIFSQGGMFGRSLRDIALWVALRESDRDGVKGLISNWPADRDYRVDPLPDRICQAFADLLFGEDPSFTPGQEGDREALEALVEANDLPSEFRRWSADCSSEGEIWWRVYSNSEISDFPIVEAHSRLDVLPLFRGRRIPAVGFFSDLWTNEVQIEGQLHIEVWRHVEIQTQGYVRNLLYKGDLVSLGQERPLTDRPETQDLEEEWDHGLEVMLAGRVPNKLGRDWRLGLSDFQGIRDQLLDLNEARTIMAENARLTARKRMVVPAAALDANGNFDAGSDVLTVESLDTDLDDKGSKGPYAILEYTFDASALIAYIDDLIKVALTRVGLTPQFGSGEDSGSSRGGAFSGTALRTKLIPTRLAAAGKARYWDDAIPKIVQALQLVDALPTESGGCGHHWTGPKDLPVVERSNALPEDPTEEVTRHVAAVAGEVESVETAVRELNPDKDDKWVNEELDRIKEDRTTFGIGQKNAPGGPQDGPPPPDGEGSVAPGGGVIGPPESTPASPGSNGAR
jgi:hypothetical protein